MMKVPYRKLIKNIPILPMSNLHGIKLQFTSNRYKGNCIAVEVAKPVVARCIEKELP